MAPNITQKRTHLDTKCLLINTTPTTVLPKKSHLNLIKPLDPTKKIYRTHTEQRDMLNYTINIQAESKLWETLQVQ